MSKKSSFSPNQALVHPSSSQLSVELTEWLGDHPFVLTSIESKGLEFEDVGVAFDADRKVWNIEEARVDSLKLLRELYVAVTRAKNRLVILVKKHCDAAFRLFRELNCDLNFVKTEFALLEFDSTTTTAEWLKKAHGLFEYEHYQHAAKCFNKAQSTSWSNWTLDLQQK